MQSVTALGRTAVVALACGGAWGGLCVGACGVIGGHSASASGVMGVPPVEVRASEYTRKPPFQFNQDDQTLLDEVQRGAFNFLWNACSAPNGAPTGHGMVVDRTSVSFVSVAGVGFQLAAIPVAIERGWVSRDEGAERTAGILRALRDEPTNRHEGLFYHYLDPITAGPFDGGPERVVSTIDSAILIAGMMVSSTYFGGEIAHEADHLIDAANWRAFVSGAEAKESDRGFISLGWKAGKAGEGGSGGDGPSGTGATGHYLPYYWRDSGDEHRLVTFLGVGAARASHAVDPATYYRLRRELGEHKSGDSDTGVFVWFPWSGALFTNFFAHCFVDYAGLGLDDPAALGVERRARVDWWESARRTVKMHQAKALENPLALATLGQNAWGLSASDCRSGYCVPGLFPNPVRPAGDIPDVDFEANYVAKDNWGDGTVAPYSAGCAILFDPERAIAAMRHMKGLRDAKGAPLVWRDPSSGGFGFLDAFNLGPKDEQGLVGEAWVAKDCVSIDQGPLVLCIENARTGLVSRLFMEHPASRRAVERLRLSSKR